MRLVVVRLVVVRLVVVVVVVVVVVIMRRIRVAMRLFAPRPADAIGQQRNARRLGQGDHLGATRDRRQRLFQEGLQFIAHPENHVRVLQGLGIGRLQRVRVRRGAARHQQGRGCDALHDAGDQRMDGHDAGDHTRCVGPHRHGEAEGG